MIQIFILKLLITWSVPETGRKGAGFGTVEETQRDGRIQINICYAEAGFLRESGRIIQQFIQLCECGFGESIKNESAPSSEPDAGERRVP